MATGPQKPNDKPDETTPDVPLVEDTADVSPRGPSVDTSGRRLRAIAQRGGTLVEVRSTDFANNGIKHDTVQFSHFKDNWTLKVGQGISEEAAKFLAKFAPETFEFLS